MTAIRGRLAAVRSDAPTRWLGFAVAAAVGLALASIHWIGFFLGGALVGLFARNLKRAVLAGVAFGLVAWLVFALWLATQGVFDTYLGTGQLRTVSVAVPIVAGAIGSLVRGLF